MRLDVNPYTLIARPKFGDEEQNEAVMRQWGEWARETHAARKVFEGIRDAMRNKSSKPAMEFADELRGPNAVQAITRDVWGASKHTSAAIREGLRRFLSTDDSVHPGGFLEWELQIQEAQPSLATIKRDVESGK